MGTVSLCDLPLLEQNIIEPIENIIIKTAEMIKLKILFLHIDLNVTIDFKDLNPIEAGVPFKIALPSPPIGPGGYLAIVPTGQSANPIAKQPPNTGASEILSQEQKWKSQCYTKNLPDSENMNDISISNDKSLDMTISKKSAISPEYLTKTILSSVANGVVYLERAIEKISDALDKVREKQPKDLGQLATKLVILKENYTMLVKCLHRLQNENFDYNIATHPDFIQFKEYASKIITNYDRSTFSKLKEFFTEESVDITSDHLLCSILGLNQSVAEYLIGIDPEVKCHQSLEYWIYTYLENQEPALNGIHIEKDFQELGFTTDRAKYLSSPLNENLFHDHLSTIQWAKQYIKYIFQYVLHKDFTDSSFSNDIGQEFTLDIDGNTFSSSNNSTDNNNELDKRNSVQAINLEYSNHSGHIRIKDYLLTQGSALEGNRPVPNNFYILI